MQIGVVGSRCVSKRCASHPESVAFEAAEKIRKAEVLISPVETPHHAGCGDAEHGVEHARKHPEATWAVLERLAWGIFEALALPQKGRPRIVILERIERVCCLLVLNLVSSTLSCIRRPRPRLLVLDVCGFV
jgi:hypothetical protein